MTSIALFRSRHSTPTTRENRRMSALKPLAPFPALVLTCALIGALCPPPTASAQEPPPSRAPGTLANPGFEGQPMKSVFFFAGQWRIQGAAFYPGPTGALLTPASNNCKYSVFPVDGGTNLGWSETAVKRDYALNNMLQAGVNVVNMSYWGPPSTDRWAFWAPMHTAPKAHDQLFDAAIGKPMLIAPYIEDADPTNDDIRTPEPGDPVHQTGCAGDMGPVGQSPGFKFADDFPGTPDDPAPALVEQIVALVQRYLVAPEKPEWREKWARMYDRSGESRYVVSLIHVGSNQFPGVADDGTADEAFAKGFTWVADRVYRDTGVRVGFTLDVLPSEHALVRFRPSAARTGKYLALQPAVLAIQPFISEIHTRRCHPAQLCDAIEAGQSPDALTDMIAWKRSFIAEWVGSGIPVIFDVSPGRDAHRIFTGADEPRYGNNNGWRNAQADMLGTLGVRGLTGNTWNGYTEGFAIVPACAFPWDLPSPGLPLCAAPRSPVEGLNRTYEWFRALTPPGGGAARLPAAVALATPPSGTYSDPVDLTFTLTRALTGPLRPGEIRTPVPDRAIHVRLGSQEAHAVTNANGVATVSVTIQQPPGDAAFPLVASFDGDAMYLSIEGRSSLLVLKEKTRVQWLPEVIPATGPVILAARLGDDDGQPVGERTVSFTLGSGTEARKCSGVTDREGVARCKVEGSRTVHSQVLSILFAGDAFYEPATAQQDVHLNPGCPSSGVGVCPGSIAGR